MRRSNLAVIICLLAPLSARAQLIHTFAGGGPGSGIPATSANLNVAGSAAAGPGGIVYVAAISGHRIFKVDSSGTLFLVAGTGLPGFNGDGGLAVNASLNRPVGLSVDSLGNVYFADSSNNRVRRIDATTGVITTIAGTGFVGYNGDGILATTANLNTPGRTVVDSQGDIFFPDELNHRVRRVDAVTKFITTVAGTGNLYYNGDNIPATSANVGFPVGIALDGSGNLYIGDNQNHRVRRVDHSTGIITTVAGNGSNSCSGDGGPATGAAVAAIFGLAVDSTGNLFIADYACSSVRGVNLSTGIITRVAGTGGLGFGGDGGPAINALFNNVVEVSVDPSGNLFLADASNNRIRRVDRATGIITTYAGNGSATFGGDGGVATGASLLNPSGFVALDASGNLYIPDANNKRVRKVDGLTGVISTIAGGGSLTADGIPPTSVSLGQAIGVAFSPLGDLYISDYPNCVIWKVDGSTGLASRFAGTFVCGFNGDNQAARLAQLRNPQNVLVHPSGDVYIVDQGNHRVRRVVASGPNAGTILTVAGTGVGGYNGDGIAAASAQLWFPQGIGFDGSGNLYVADATNNRVRRVDAATRIITTVAGTGAAGYNGDNILATNAWLRVPRGVWFDSSGELFIADTDNQRVRRVDASTHLITTVAGTGLFGFSGDGGPAVAANLAGPVGVSFDPNGALLIVEYNNNRVRQVSGPAVTLSAAGLDFGHIQVGTQTTAQTVTVTNTGAAPLTISSVSASGDYPESDNCTGSPIAAGGSCTASVSFLPTATGTRTGTLTITDNAPGSPQTVSLTGMGDPAATIISINAPSITYNANGSVTLTVTAGAGTPTGSVSLTVDGGAPITQALSGGSTSFTITSPPAGDHSLSASYAAQGNFAASSATGTLHVDKATPTVTVTDPMPTYDGNPHSATATAVGVDGHTGVIGTFSFTYDLSGTAPTNAKTSYAVVATFTSSDPNYTGATGNGALTIKQATPAVTVTDPMPTYDGNAHSPTATAKGVGGANVSGTFAFTYDGNAAPPTNAKTSYAVAATFTSSDPNYTDGTGNGSLTISQRPASVTPTAANKIYGDSDPALTGTLSGFLAGDGVVASYSRVAGETVAGSPYTISATLNPVGVLGNYTVAYNTANFTISPRPITVTADSKSKTYGDPDPALTYQITSGSLASSDSFGGALTRVSGQNVGTYPIQQGPLVLNGNYALSYVGANLTISQRQITVTAVGNGKVFNGTTSSSGVPAIGPGTLAYTDTPSFTQTFDNKNVGSGKTLTPAGSVNDGNGGANYSVVFVPQNLGTITARPISVAADAKTMIYGTADPTLTFQVTSGSLVTGDTFSGGLTRAAGETVAGSPYGILQGTLTAGTNYSLGYTGANLAITKAASATTVVSSAGSSTLNAPVTFTATVADGSAGSSGTPTGTVTFTDSTTSTTLGTSTLAEVGGQDMASLTYSGLPVNSQTIVATYNGDGNFSGSSGSSVQTVHYASGGVCYGDLGHSILQPINADGSSVWKQGSTVPAKFRVCDSNGVSIGASNVISLFVLYEINGGTVAPVDETAINSTNDLGWHFDPTGEQWIFNMSTKTAPQNVANQTYYYRVDLSDGSHIFFQFGLK